MNYKTEISGKRVIISIQEERLDAHNSLLLKEEFLRQLKDGVIDIIVDLKEVRFIDSSGLGVLVSGYKNTSAIQGTLKLSALQAQVKSMFELTRLHRVFDIYSSVDEAIASY